jgi:uncharacterized delta-60 repeat protein
VTRRALLLALTAAWLVAGAPQASAEVAPGLVTVPLRHVGARDGIDPSGLSVGAALPDGRVVLAGLDPRKGLVLAQLRVDGSLDPAFGTGGVAHLPLPIGPPFIGPEPLQLLRLADGRLVIAVEGETRSRFELRQLLVVRLTPDGRPDASFGAGGVARPGVQAGCGDSCEPMALYPDGSIALAGATGSQPPFAWVVARLTPGGALDASFGSGGVATVGDNGTGYAAAVQPGGGIASVGHLAGRAKLVSLTATGASDPAFHGGAPVDLPAARFWFHLRTHDGRLDALGSGGGATQLRRYAPSGEPDDGFGAHGAVLLPRSATGIDALAPGPGGGSIVTGPTTLNPGTELPGLRVSRVSPAGAVTGTGVVPIPFGGGYATRFTTIRAPAVGPLRQGSFRAGTPVARPDGTLVVPGSVAVIENTGEGAGVQSDQGAAAALTTGFALDRSFGAPRHHARVRLRVPRQRARSAAGRRRMSVLVTATTSGPGLCLLRVKAGRHVVARSLAPAFKRGRQRLRALLTIPGRRRLRHAHRLHVTVAVTFRDLVGAQARASARAVLR